MANHVDRSTASTPPAHASSDPLWYWWQVCRGVEVMRAFHAAPEHEAWSVVSRYPVLLMPELVAAAEQTLGRSRAIDGLRQMHQSLRGTPHHAAYHRLLVTVLAKERSGSRRVNLERALAVMQDVRGTAAAADREADARTEQAIRAALDALTPVPTAKPPAVHALFLDDAELAGFRRGEDRRDVNPNLHDRAYTTHGGLATGSAVWIGDEAAPVYRIVDARWVFPSTKAAKAYIDSPATLLLSGDGLPNPAVLTIGDAGYAWGGASPGSSPARRSRQCLLFRVDRVVARLDVTEGPRAAQAFQALSRSHLLPYADAVIRRVRWVLAQYWLAIGRGTEAAQRFMQASPRTATQLFADYPILLLPEFPTAMASLGEPHRAAAERLASLQAALKGNWQTYRDVMRALVRMLLDETTGEPLVNADAAHRLVVAHRRLDSDYSWATVETECRTRTR